MKTIGIVAEYNPFHLGHAWHIRESRRKAAAEGEETAVIAVMSGDYVQRGEAAVFSKFARAEAACRSGADLVVELPLPWALSSAESFAEGAVSLLAALGAERISFGSETAELPLLEELAELILDPAFTEETCLLLKADPAQSFAVARQACAEARLGRALPELQQPNNILALEYLKAIRKNGLSLEPIAVRRRGAGHDETGENDIPSAAELRKRIRNGETVGYWLPTEAEAVFQRETEAGRTAFDSNRQELLLRARLRFLREEDFLLLPDAGEGLGTRLYRAVREQSSYSAILAAAVTKRYPLARIRRLCMSAALGLREGDREGIPSYARVLALNAKGRALLRRADRNPDIPLLTKPAHVHELETGAQKLFLLGAQAHDFYTLFYPVEEQQTCGEDWKTGPAICI